MHQIIESGCHGGGSKTTNSPIEFPFGTLRQKYWGFLSLVLQLLSAN